MKTKTIAALLKKKKKTMGKQGSNTSPIYSFRAAEPPAHDATLRGSGPSTHPNPPMHPALFLKPISKDSGFFYIKYCKH
jgi:hypothetical protein